MPNKPPGGRGKRESYSSSVVRVPDPIKPQILELIEGFHQNRADDASKPVTGLSQIPVSLITELIEIAYPEEWEGDTFLISCDLSVRRWNKKYDKEWEKYCRPKIEKINQLADRVNRCIWQIDNTFASAQPGDIKSVVTRLLEYGLLLMDSSTPSATTQHLLDWMFSSEYHRENFKDAAWEAFQQKRFDILKALEIGQKRPINRREYWHHKYREQLARIGVNYWGWRDNPESREICPELTMLLELPEPSPDARIVLECLADGKDPFFKPEFKGRTENEMFVSFVANLGKVGALAECKPDLKQAYRQAFIQWHDSTLTALSRNLLERIYKVVFGCNWDLIEVIIDPIFGEWWEVLGISPNASAQEVKAARQRLAKKWHPDVNPSPLALERMTKINQAVEEFTCNRFS